MLPEFKLLGGAIASLGLAGAAIGSGVIFAAYVLSVSRNPSLKNELFSIAILGFALTEALGLFSLMMALLFIYAF